MKIDNRTAEERTFAVWQMGLMRGRTWLPTPLILVKKAYYVTMAQAATGVNARMAAHEWVADQYWYLTDIDMAKQCGHCLVTPAHLIPNLRK